MTREISHHQPNGKKPLQYNLQGMHISELMEIALDHPIWFIIISYMINHNVAQKIILKLIRRVV